MNYYAIPAAEFQAAEFQAAEVTIKTVIAERVIQTVCQLYNISEEQIKGSVRKEAILFPRHLAMYAIRSKTGMSYQAIGNLFNGKDHTTARNGVISIQNYIETDSLGKRAEILEVIHKL